MTKQKIDSRMIVTKTAEDFADDFTSVEEVDFRDMKIQQEKQNLAHTSQQLPTYKQNFTCQYFSAEKKIVISWDLA
jgi:hypothetical protein